MLLGRGLEAVQLTRGSKRFIFFINQAAKVTPTNLLDSQSTLLPRQSRARLPIHFLGNM